jgi:hypothetical protein
MDCFYIEDISLPVLKENFFINAKYCNRQKEILSNIKDILNNKILPIMEDLYKDINLDWQDDIDIRDVTICGKGISEYTAFMEYLEICFHFQGIFQLWEQQVEKAIFYSIGRTRALKKKTNKNIDGLEITKIDFEDFIKVLLVLDIDCTEWDIWAKIIEIKKIVNVIKHGAGNSLEMIKLIKPSVINYKNDGKGYEFDTVTFDHSSLLDFNLALTKYNEYIDILCNFWDLIPNRVEKEGQEIKW